jgi:hypothetical protein
MLVYCTSTCNRGIGQEVSKEELDPIRVAPLAGVSLQGWIPKLAIPKGRAAKRPFHRVGSIFDGEPLDPVAFEVYQIASFERQAKQAVRVIAEVIVRLDFCHCPGSTPVRQI